MKSRFLIGLIMMLTLALFMSAGCASKKKVGPDADTDAAAAEAEAAAQAEADRQRQIAERELQQQKEQASVDVQQRVHFGYDSYELSPDAREILQGKAKALKQFPRVTVVIEGYCDDRGTEEYNLALGERRARAAYEFLVLLGIEPERLSFVSYGEENPLDPSQNEQAWSLNRRAEFRMD